MSHEISREKGVCGGKACLRGTRIRVIDIIERYKVLKEMPEEIAAAFDIPIDSVFSALAYYYKNAGLIKREIEEDRAFVKKLKASMKSVSYAA